MILNRSQLIRLSMYFLVHHHTGGNLWSISIKVETPMCFRLSATATESNSIQTISLTLSQITPYFEKSLYKYLYQAKWFTMFRSGSRPTIKILLRFLLPFSHKQWLRVRIQQHTWNCAQKITFNVKFLLAVSLASVKYRALGFSEDFSLLFESLSDSVRILNLYHRSVVGISAQSDLMILLRLCQKLF